MRMVSRRVFLQTACVAAGAAPLASCSWSGSRQSAPGEVPMPCASTAWQKHGVILEPTEPWEGDGIENFTSPAEPLGGGAWRLWYSVSGKRRNGLAYAEGVPGERMKKVLAQCSPGEPPDAPFAIGGLPEGWRPVQVVHLRLRNGRHRIYFWAHGEGILRYLAADSSDGRRYRVLNPLRPVLYHPHDRAAHGVASPDGVVLHREPSRNRPAEEPLAPSRLISNDATNVYQLADGTFEMYSVALVPVPKGDPAYIEFDNAPGLIRVVDRYTSEDGLHFETRERVVQRDGGDPADQQFYYLAVTWTGRGRVGVLGHYRCAAQTMDVEWCFSRDGVRWERPLRQAWLARGESPSPDCNGI
ncbi:MAG: twin-arginine translocation signal domain-containing protein [Verrucomicrobiales bacterium]|nr:twin-arginine translocation signal domain-containing protein [Verrucomicrobiales bacterium]